MDLKKFQGLRKSSSRSAWYKGNVQILEVSLKSDFGSKPVVYLVLVFTCDNLIYSLLKVQILSCFYKLRTLKLEEILCFRHFVWLRQQAEADMVISIEYYSDFQNHFKNWEVLVRREYTDNN